MKVALITDWMISPGGSDRMLIHLLELYPEADIFTPIYVEKNYKGDFAINATVKTSFLQKLSFSGRLQRHFNPFAPFAFESFDLTGYDVVISLSAGAAKGVITAPDQPHIAIILTPPRWLWDRYTDMTSRKKHRLFSLLSSYLATHLRVWDQTAILRNDELVSISEFINKKVRKTYRRDSILVYPGIDQFWFEVSEGAKVDERVWELAKEPFFLVVSRLYEYKRIDMAVEAVKGDEKGRRLLVVGSGPELRRLRDSATEKVVFLGRVDDLTVRYLYGKAEALIFPGVEDFGYVPVEAMASGCPVIAYNEGGVTETVVESESGTFFDSGQELSRTVSRFNKAQYSKDKIIRRAEKFRSEKFKKEISEIINKHV